MRKQATSVTVAVRRDTRPGVKGEARKEGRSEIREKGGDLPFTLWCG